MEGFLKLSYTKGDFPVTEKMADEIFSLPIYPSLTEQQQATVVAELLEVITGLQ